MKKIVLVLTIGFLLPSIVSLGFYRNPTHPGTPDDVTTTLLSHQEKKETGPVVVYTCPMHPEIIKDKTGKCPKCGMNLVKKEASKDVYTCPMHSEVTQDKAGKCPKCGMDLVKKAQKLKEEPKK